MSTRPGGASAADRGDVLVVGDLMVDIVARHRDALAHASDVEASVELVGGGSAANAACWLASLGERPRLLAARGADDLGALARRQLETAGVGLVGPVVDDAATGVCVVLVDAAGERTMLPDRGANDRLPAAAVARALQEPPGWVHLSGYALLHDGSRAAGQAAVAAGLAAGAVVSVDAASSAPIRAVGAPSFLGWIHGASLVLANDDEVEALGGAAAVLAHVGELVVKHGAAGATWTDGREEVHVEGVAVDAVDSTGAGDAFAAGWIAAVRSGLDVHEALAAAARTGAAAVTVAGARPLARDGEPGASR